MVCVLSTQKGIHADGASHLDSIVNRNDTNYSTVIKSKFISK